MKSLIIFEEVREGEPIAPMLDAVREVIARPPALNAEVISLLTANLLDPIERICNVCELALLTMQVHSDAELGAFFLPSLIRTRAGEVAFRGQIVLTFTREHFLKLSLVESTSTSTKPDADVFFGRVLSEMVRKFSFIALTDDDRQLIKLIIERATQGMNLATSRLSVHSGSA